MAEEESQPQAKPNAGFAALWRFLPMLWPKDDAELKARVGAALLLVLAGKGVILLGPYALKLAVDRMSAHAPFAIVAELMPLRTQTVMSRMGRHCRLLPLAMAAGPAFIVTMLTSEGV